MEEYGTRLHDYSVKNGKKLYRIVGNGRGEGREYKIGIISSSNVIYHGPIRVETWELENGEKYHHY
jgi:hypothetical protein